MTDHRWQRQEWETDLAWRAFVLYRDTPEMRSCTKLAEALGVELSEVVYLFNNHDWVERCDAFDRWRAEQTALTGETLADKQNEIGRVLQGIGLKAINEMLKDPAHKLSPTEAKALVEAGARLQAGAKKIG